MNKPRTSSDIDEWLKPNSDPTSPEYYAWLEQEIAEALAEAAAGELTPLEDVRKEFGLE